MSLKTVRSQLNCPICTSIFVCPLYYDCGHSVCQPCHISIDEETVAKLGYTRNYKCPICRKPSIQSWHYRKKNRALDEVCQLFPEYHVRAKKTPPPSATTKKIPSKINLARVSEKIREELCNKLYHTIMPLLIVAAEQGLAKFVVSEKETKTEMDKVLDLLSHKFFTHGVYRIISNSEDVVILFTTDADELRKIYTNSTIPGSPSPPPPPPSSRLTNRYAFNSLIETMRRSENTTAPPGI